MELVLRFVAGGVLVSLFACIGEILEPKSFAGLFGAAPSVALASLGLTIAIDGVPQAVIECRSMLMGAVAFGCYGAFVTWLLMRYRVRVTKAALGSIVVWFAVALGLWWIAG